MKKVPLTCHDRFAANQVCADLKVQVIHSAPDNPVVAAKSNDSSAASPPSCSQPCPATSHQATRQTGHHTNAHAFPTRHRDRRLDHRHLPPAPPPRDRSDPDRSVGGGRLAATDAGLPRGAGSAADRIHPSQSATRRYSPAGAALVLTHAGFCVDEPVTIRYDPRDLAEIRVPAATRLPTSTSSTTTWPPRSPEPDLPPPPPPVRIKQSPQWRHLRCGRRRPHRRAARRRPADRGPGGPQGDRPGRTVI
jgi:hypothetical protein